MRLFLLLLAAFPAFAQHALEVIPLRHRTVDQVVPVLRPLLEPGGTLAGQANQLIVRASPANLAELRRALEAIDRPQRRLQILVRLEEHADTASRGVEASGRIGNRGSRIDVRAQDERARAEERVDQRIQVLEGARAFIATGQSTAIPQQEAIVIRETATGFEAVPRVSGETVFLDISQQRETPGGQFQRASTTVSGRLGEWFEVGGTAGAASRDERAILSGSRAGSSQARRIWVKVEELR
jgi:type II secretory pathway component GspD/PulD (secretin)